MEWPPWQQGWVGMAQQRRRCAYGVRGAPRLDVRSQPPPPSNSKYVNPPVRCTCSVNEHTAVLRIQLLVLRSGNLSGYAAARSNLLLCESVVLHHLPSLFCAFLLTMCLFYFNKIGSYYNQPQPSPGQRICMFRIFMQKYKIDQDRAGIAYFF